jgi:methanethiol S-methyltransferase
MPCFQSKTWHFLFRSIFTTFVFFLEFNSHFMILLSLAWLLYGAIHSLMAGKAFKNLMLKILGKNFRFYRLIYNAFAFALLVPVLTIQFSTEKISLWQVSDYQGVIGKFICVFGVIFIATALQGYDLGEFSGIDFKEKNEPPPLKTDGLLEYVRHPIYFGILLLVWGLFISDASTRSLAGAIAVTIYLFVGIHFEEKKLVSTFGEQYRKYQKDVAMLIPFLRV